MTSEPVRPQNKLSKKFRSPSADVTFISCDGTEFNIHSTHLNSCSAGFAIPGTGIDVSDPVLLSEPADVLELLFQFIEPPTEAESYRFPSVTTMGSKIFFELAEAAQKYIVYSAMSNCTIRLELSDTFVQHYPFQTLNYAAKHGYPVLADSAALKGKALDRRLSRAAMILEVLARWNIYFETNSLSFTKTEIKL